MSLLLKIGEARGWRARVAPWLVAKLAASSELKTFMSDRVVHVFRGALAACWLVRVQCTGMRVGAPPS